MQVNALFSQKSLSYKVCRFRRKRPSDNAENAVVKMKSLLVNNFIGLYREYRN